MTDALALLPETADRQSWNTQQTALMESLGLRGEKNVQRNGQWAKVPFEAPQSIVEAFLYQIRRTGLDPVARQIYCIERGGKWGIQASIDGFRLIAERSGEYAGQTPVQWTADGVTWTDVWLDASNPPAAARVGIYRRGFTEPMWAVATYAGYVPRDRQGNPKPSGQWDTNPSNQLAKCAEMLGLRKAFPQDLSGIYGTEEMDQAQRVSPEPSRRPQNAQQPQSTPEAPSVATQDWAARVLDVNTIDDLRAVHGEAEKAGELGRPLNPQYGQGLAAVVEFFHLPKPPADVAVGGLIQAVKAALEKRAAEEVVEGEVLDDVPVVDTELHNDGAPVANWPTREPGSGLPEREPEA